MTACDAEFGLKEIKGQLVSEGIRWSPRWGGQAKMGSLVVTPQRPRWGKLNSLKNSSSVMGVTGGASTESIVFCRLYLWAPRTSQAFSCVL